MNAIKRPISEHAKTAKALRQYCKSLGVPASATSDSFSMGNSVTVRIADCSPDLANKIKAKGQEHQYGHFNGMEDIYEYSNKNEDIPQAKYVSVELSFSDELKQSAWDAVRSYCANCEDAPESYEEAGNYRVFEDFAPTQVWRFLCGNFLEDESVKFWQSKTAAPAALTTTTGATIEEHTHTKRNFQMFIVIIAERVERETYLQYLEAAKALDGWYSRKWGQTPAGFAFKAMEDAQAFAATLSGSTPPPTTDGSPKPNTHQAEKLRTLADKMQSEIDGKFADRLTNTPKRQREAGSARLEGEKLLRTQTALNGLADLHEAGTVPAELSTIKSKKAVYELMGAELDSSRCGYYDTPRDTGQPRHTTPAALALWSMLTDKTDEEKQADKLREMLQAIQFSKIPGFFATQTALRAQMFDLADVQPGHRLLEPEAGAGGIADDAKGLGAVVDCCEVWNALRDILEAKGHNLIGHDFLDTDIKAIYDRIVMNPPFEKLQDIAHVMKAYNCLKNGGRVVSIMSPGPFYRQDKKCVEFRQWFEDLNGEKIDVPAGAFKESGTDVSSVIIVIDKPEQTIKSDLTPEGEQLVIPGADKEQTNAQGSLWG